VKSAVIAVPEERAEGTPAQCPTYPPDVTSLLGVLQHQWRHMPERIVCTRIVRQRKALSLQPLSVADLGVRAVRAATALQLAGARGGDRIILSLSDPHDFLVAFFSTLMAGASAVPLPTVVDSAPRSFAARVRSVCKGCRPAVAVVDGLRRFHETVGRLPPQLRLLEPADLEGTTGAPADIPEPSSSLPAFIQYTSGSTGEPKGVVITHGNILANCNAIRDATGYTRADRMVSWLPLHHDMGLVGGLLTSIYCAAETFIMPPLLFLARPVTWLEAISRCAASLTVAPTFAYSLCARKIPPKQLEGVDLSSLRLAYVGAEPIDPVTLAAFVERFSPYGLSPQPGRGHSSRGVSTARQSAAFRYS
jgi:fatty-acyl-CoA synthase